MKQKTDKELMDLYLLGNAAAFEELYLRYRPKVYAYFISRLSKENAEDLFQKVFFKVHKNKAYYKNKYSFTSWIYTICRNTFIDFLRENQKEGEKVPLEKLEYLFSSSVSSEEKTIPKQYLDKMNPRYREILLERIIKGKDYSQISNQFGLSQSSARKVFSRALGQLKTIFQSEQPNG